MITRLVTYCDNAQIGEIRNWCNAQEYWVDVLVQDDGKVVLSSGRMVSMQTDDALALAQKNARWIEFVCAYLQAFPSQPSK